mmetsp:Transcript_5203/g.10618  ORF Transcript_5203/g.10618 Transcript_5203/m.10618 type:complete len:131 (-) Transcript_5203:764-1156(-)
MQNLALRLLKWDGLSTTNPTQAIIILHIPRVTLAPATRTVRPVNPARVCVHPPPHSSRPRVVSYSYLQDTNNPLNASPNLQQTRVPMRCARKTLQAQQAGGRTDERKHQTTLFANKLSRSSYSGLLKRSA